ncbi:MAG: hypothetical protein LBR66_04905 [Candidatus Symbiothrix sp.]|jgi:hypothetical protein|nr:hypothetical protein [Candidatus Symbiothrix sp.]
MNTLKKIVFTGFSLLAGVVACAQSALNVETVFQDYGKQKGVVLIELAKDVLGNHTKISRFKCMILSTDTLEKVIFDAIWKDLDGGQVMMESKKDGKIQKACYCLKKKSDSPTYEYILFSNKSKKTTLIYLRGNFPPQQLDDELETLQHLFIKANNESIKFNIKL